MTTKNAPVSSYYTTLRALGPIPAWDCLKLARDCESLDSQAVARGKEPYALAFVVGSGAWRLHLAPCACEVAS